ncbi:tape measure protein [Microbacterium sp. MMO-56]|uniref:tape measure protein n=1 Tax=Microbacterium sp. MMO-56 TaxID=3081281 RepID=UPI00301842E6
MSKEVGAGHVAIFPVYKGLRKSIKNEVDRGVNDAERSATKGLGKAGQRGGAALGKGLKSALSTETSNLGDKALKTFQQDVATTTRTLSSARLRQMTDAGNVRVAEQRLAEVIEKSGAGSSQAIAAEERLAAARRNLEVSTDRVATASTNLQAAQAKLTTAQDALTSSTARLTKVGAGTGFATFRKNLTDVLAPVTLLARGITGLATRALAPVTSRLSSFGARVGTAVVTPLRNATVAIRDLSLKGALRLSSALGAVETSVARALAPALNRLAPVTAAIRRSFSGMAGVLGQTGGAVRQAFSGVGSIVGAAGSAISSGFASAMDGVKRVTGDAATFVKSQLGAAAAVVTGAIAASVAGGFGRLSAIETAQAKLRGLGNTAEDVQTITTNALDAVRGTAYGLDEAASIAASAVAAGIKPGEELEKYLRLTADAASIANVPLSEMGSILNKVTTNGRAYTTELNQLADRGIPIYQWLAQELNVTQDELRDMVAAGKVDAATYRSAIEKNIGGAALEAGKTTQGALKNMRAAFSRFGATMLGPIFPLFQQLFSTITVGVDAVAAKIAPIADVIGKGVVARVEPILTRMSDAFARLKESTSGFNLSGLSGVFAVLLPVVAGVLGALGPLLARLPLLGAMFSGLTAPVGLLAGALASLLLFDPATLMAGFQAIVPAVVGGVSSLLTKVVELISKFVPQIATQLASNVPILVSGMVQLLLGLVQAVTAVLPSLLAAIVGVVPVLVGALVGMVPQLLQAGIQLLTGLIDAVGVVVPLLVNAVVELLPKLLETILAMLPAVVASALQVFMGLVQALIGVIPQLITTLISALPKILQTLLGMLPTLIQSAIQLFLGLVLGLAKAIPQLLVALVGMLPQILTTLVEMLPQLIITAVDVFLGLVTGLLEAIPQLIVAIIEMIPQIVVALISMIPTLIEGAVKLFTGLLDALPVIIPKLLDALVKMGPQLVDAIMKIIPALFDAGVSLVQALIDGLGSMLGSLWDAVGGIVGGIVDFFPHSPAKKGPLSAPGWRRLKQSGAATMEQFTAGAESRVDGFGVALAAATQSASQRAQIALTASSSGVNGSGSAGTGSRGTTTISQINHFAHMPPEEGAELAGQKLASAARRARA